MQYIFIVVLGVVIFHNWPFVLAAVVVLIVLAVLYAILDQASGSTLTTPEKKSGDITIEIEIKRKRQSRKSPSRTFNNSSKALMANVGSKKLSLTTSGHYTAPTRGLVIMARPLQQILDLEKTLELRSKHNRQLGTVALIKKGSGQVFGLAEITESIGPMSVEDLHDRRHEHGVEEERVTEVFDRGWVYGWRMSNVVTLKQAVPYVHKGMSQVNLDQKAIDAIQLQLDTM